MLCDLVPVGPAGKPPVPNCHDIDCAGHRSCDLVAVHRSGIAIVLALAGCSSDPEPSGSAAGGSGGVAFLDASADVVDGGGSGGSSGGAPDAAIEVLPPFDGPEKLSEAGLYSDIVQKTLADGVMPYSVRFPLWSDGSDKQRFLYLPPGTQIDTSDMDSWRFPIGTRVFKEFSVAGKRIETRLLEKRWEGTDGWLMVSYLWNEAGTEATAVPAGQQNALGTEHDVPSIDLCAQCHSAGDLLAGVGAIQLSSPTGNGALSELSASGKLTQPPAGEFDPPGDGDVEAALGYLHGNCGHCHNDEHWLAGKRQLRLKLFVAEQTPEETLIYQTMGSKMSHLIEGSSVGVVPGKPAESQIWQRMQLRNGFGMPPVGTEKVDTAAVTLIGDWITNLPP